jgi:hypothetical protein
MSRAHRAARVALVVIAGVVGVAGTTSTAAAQRAHPRQALAGQPAPVLPSVPYTPYPGATVTIDPRGFGRPAQAGPLRRHQPRRGSIVYVVPSYPYYPSAGYGSGVGGGVYDTNGRPLGSAYEEMAASAYAAPHGTPDLSGSPYVVIQGGVMMVEFGNGDTRPVPSCAALSSESTPDGKPRTLFYQPSYGLVLRAGQRGRVIGAPPAGARVCYTSDAYGRTVLDY